MIRYKKTKGPEDAQRLAKLEIQKKQGHGVFSSWYYTALLNKYFNSLMRKGKPQMVVN